MAACSHLHLGMPSYLPSSLPVPLSALAHACMASSVLVHACATSSALVNTCTPSCALAHTHAMHVHPQLYLHAFLHPCLTLCIPVYACAMVVLLLHFVHTILHMFPSHTFCALMPCMLHHLCQVWVLHCSLTSSEAHFPSQII